MKKFSMISAFLLAAASTFNAGAQMSGLGNASGLLDYGPINGSYVVAAYQVVVTWAGQDVSFTGPSPSFTLKVDQESSTLSTVYLAENGEKNTELKKSDQVIFEFPFTMEQGNYTLMIPGGMVADASGNENPAQNISFTIAEKLDGTDALISPALSLEMYEGAIPVPAPEYTASELSDVTISWPGITLKQTNTTGLFVTAYKEQEIVGEPDVEPTPGAPNEVIPVSYLVSVEGEKISLDLSSFEAGKWHINIPTGYVSGLDADNKVYTNGGISLIYIISGNTASMDDYEVFSPENGNYVNYIDNVSVTWDRQFIEFAVENPVVKVEFGGMAYDIIPEIINNSLDGYYLDVNFFGEALDAGQPDGPYIINIPAATVKNAEGATNPAISLKYTKVSSIPAMDIAVSPEPGLVAADDMATVTLTFEGFESLELNPDAGDVMVFIGQYVENVGYSENYILPADAISTDGNKLNISIDNPVNGLLNTIMIPTLYVIADGVAANNTMYLEYTPWNGMGEAIVMEAPQGDVLYVSPVQLTWDYQTIEIADESLGAQIISGYDPVWGRVIATVPVSEFKWAYMEEPGDDPGEVEPHAEGNYNVLLISIEKYLEGRTGQFFVVLPRGIVKNQEGELNPYQVVADFFITTAWEGEAIFNEDNGFISLTWEDAFYVDVNNKNLAPTVTYDYNGMNEYPETVYEPEYEIVNEQNIFDEEGNLEELGFHGVVFNIEELGLEDGNYCLNISEGFVSIASEGWATDGINLPLSYSFTVAKGSVTSVGILQGDIKGYSVFNLQGMKVLDTDNAADLKKLAKGIYIVNGRKVAF